MCAGAGEEDLQRALGNWRPAVALANLAEPKQRVRSLSVDEQGSLFGLGALSGDNPLASFS